MDLTFYFEVRCITTNSLVGRGLRSNYTKALAAVMGHGIKKEQVYSQLGSPGALKAFGCGESNDGFPITFNVLQMEVK